MNVKDSVGASKAKNTIKVKQQFLVVLGLVAVVLVVIVINLVTSAALRDEVAVAVLKSNVPKDAQITSANVEQKMMNRREFENYAVLSLSDGTKKRAICTWEDRDKIIGTYAQYYLRYDTPIYWDSLTKSVPKDHSYLYQMDGELLQVSEIDPAAFGELVVPGDRVNLRVTYSDNEFRLPTQEEYSLLQQTGMSVETKVIRREMMFNGVTIIDILNKQGGSIFDIYYDLLELPKKQQEAKMGTKEFIDSVKPASVLLVVTPEEADRYMDVSGKSPSYLMTLLPREGSNLILDALAELQVGFAR